MSINSNDLENILDTDALKALGVEIDYVNRKVYVTAHRDNVDFIKEYMAEQDFNFVGESIKIRYDHDGVGCQEPMIQDTQDPVRCYEFSSSSSSSLGDESCTPSINVDIFGVTAEGACDPVTKTLDIADGCGCDETNNCLWRKDELPEWYEVFDTNAADYIIINYQLNKAGSLYTETSLPSHNTKVIGKDEFGATASVNLSGNIDYWSDSISGPAGNYAEWRRIDWHKKNEDEARFQPNAGSLNTRYQYLLRNFRDEWKQVSVDTGGNQWVNTDPDLIREVFWNQEDDTNSQRNLQTKVPLRFNSSNDRYQFVYSDISYSDYISEFIVYNVKGSDIDHNNNEQWSFVIAVWEDIEQEFNPQIPIQNGSGNHPVVHTLSVVRNCNTSSSGRTVGGRRASLVLDYDTPNQKVILDLDNIVPLEISNGFTNWNRYISKIKIERILDRFIITIGNAVNMDYDQNPTNDYYDLMFNNRDFSLTFDLDSYTSVDSLTVSEQAIIQKFKGSAPWGLGNKSDNGVWSFDELQFPYDPDFGESVLINLQNLRQDNPNEVFFELSAKARMVNNFNIRREGIKVSIDRYNGGSPYWNGYRWVVTGGTLVKKEDDIRQKDHIPWTQNAIDNLHFYPGNTLALGAIYNFYDGTNPERISDKYGYDDNTTDITFPIDNIDHVSTEIKGNVFLNSGSVDLSGDGFILLHDNKSMFNGSGQYCYATEIGFKLNSIPDENNFEFIFSTTDNGGTTNDGDYLVYLHNGQLWVAVAPDTGSRWYLKLDVNIETNKFYHLIINTRLDSSPQTEIYLNSELIGVNPIIVNSTLRDYNCGLGGLNGTTQVEDYDGNILNLSPFNAPDFIPGVGGYMMKGTIYAFAHYRTTGTTAPRPFFDRDMVQKQYRNLLTEKFSDIENVYADAERTPLTNHYFQQDDEFTQIKVEDVNGINRYVLRQVERTTYYNIGFDPDISIDDIIELDRCPCLFAPQRTCIDYNINVLINIKEDFDSAVNNYEFENEYSIKNLAKIQEGTSIVNNCHGYNNIYQPNGVFVENDELYKKWVDDLIKGSFSIKEDGQIVKRRCVSVSKLTENCDFDSSSSSSSSFSSESSLSGESTSSSSSSRSSESSSSDSSSESSSSLSSDSSTSSNSSSSTSSTSNSSSSSSFDERCEPKIYGNNRFGQSVVFNENGSRVFVSSLEDAKIWVYDINLPNPPTGVPGYTFVETITGITGIDFGWSIDVSADGSELVVGAPGYDNDKGRIYHYTDIGGFSLSGSYTPSDASGVSVENPKGDRFGHAVDISSNGNYFAIGSPYHKNNTLTNGWQSGAVYVIDSTLSLREKVQPNDGQQQDFFGWDVSINVDGSRFVASSFDDDELGIRSGSVYVFDWNGLNYIENAKLTASDGDEEQRFGKSVSIASLADVIVVGAYKDNNINGVFAGAIYEYRWNGGSWVETKIITNDSVDGSSFGFDVSLNACGNAFAATALSYQEPYEDVDGDLYIFTYNGSWTQEIKFTDNLEATDRYGYVATMSENGIYVATSSPTYNTNEGMVHIYNLDDTCYSVSVNCIDEVESSSSGTTSSSQSSSSISSSSSSSSSSSISSSSSSSSSLSSSSESSFAESPLLMILDMFTNEVGGYINGNLYEQTPSSLFVKGVNRWEIGDDTSDIQIVDFNPPPFHPDIDRVEVGALSVQYSGPRHGFTLTATREDFGNNQIFSNDSYMSLFIHLDDFISDGEDTAWAQIGLNDDNFGTGIDRESMFIGVESDNNAINYITIAYGAPSEHLFFNRKRIYEILDPSADIIVVLKVNTPNVEAWVFDANDINRPNIGSEFAAGSPIYSASDVSSRFEVRHMSVICGGVPAVAPVYFKNFRVGYTWDSVTQQ